MRNWYEYQGRGTGVFNGIPYCFGNVSIARDRGLSLRSIQAKLKNMELPGAERITSGVCSGWNTAPIQTTRENIRVSYSEPVVQSFKEAFDRIENLEEGEQMTIIVRLPGSTSDTVIAAMQM